MYTAPAAEQWIVRHRLSCGGNRHINRMLHTMAVIQPRNPTASRDYFDRKKVMGKSSNETIRCLKRGLSDAVYRVMTDNLAATTGTDPGGQRAISSAIGSQPEPALRQATSRIR